MKIFGKGFCLLLLLGAQVFAQRFTAAPPDTFRTGFVTSEIDTGYLSYCCQAAALGEKNSSYSNLMLLKGRDMANTRGTYNVVSSQGNILGTIYPMSSTNSFVTPEGTTVSDNNLGGVLVLDSLNDSKKSATVLFSTLSKLSIVQITISE